MLIKRFTMMIAMLAVWPVSLSAESSGGFALTKYAGKTGEISPHVRLIFNKSLTEEWGASLVVSPVGPMPILTYGYLTRIFSDGRVEIGRLFPIFGREWSYYRVDKVPMLNYSNNSRRLVAIDTGIAATSNVGRTKIYCGAFLGDRVFGEGDAGADLYLRLEYQAMRQMTIASSQRISSAPLSGIDILLEDGRTDVVLEAIQNEYSVQIEYRLNKAFSTAARWQDDSWAVALTYTLNPYEFKLLSEAGSKMTIQAGVAW